MGVAVPFPRPPRPPPLQGRQNVDGILQASFKQRLRYMFGYFEAVQRHWPTLLISGGHDESAISIPHARPQFLHVVSEEHAYKIPGTSPRCVVHTNVTAVGAHCVLSNSLSLRSSQCPLVAFSNAVGMRSVRKKRGILSRDSTDALSRMNALHGRLVSGEEPHRIEELLRTSLYGFFTRVYKSSACGFKWSLLYAIYPTVCTTTM